MLIDQLGINRIRLEFKGVHQKERRRDSRGINRIRLEFKANES